MNSHTFLSVCRGFTLVEVMVSVFVLSVGIFGIVGMQLNAFRSNQQSAIAVLATQLAQDMAERIRANDGVTSLSDAQNPYLFDTSDTDAAHSPPKGCYAVQCTPAEMAAADIHEWKMRIVGEGVNKAGDDKPGRLHGLPGGRGVICRDDTAWDNDGGYRWKCSTGASHENAPIVLKIGWYDRNADGSMPRNAQGAYDDRPAMVFVVKP